MAAAPPTVDPRTAEDVARQVRLLLPKYVDAWKNTDPESLKSDVLGAALTGVFARFAELIIDRLNKIPEKNLLAFLDLLGASLLPPQPARAPLTFTLAAGSLTDARVPAGTQVAAPPGEGETAPVIFETERELVVTAAQLTSVFVRDPGSDQYADCGGILTVSSPTGVSVFRGNRSIEHIFYIGDDEVLGYPGLAELDLTFALGGSGTAQPDPRTLQWEIWDGENGIPITPQNDGTKNLTTDGTVSFTQIGQVAQATVQSVESRWLRARLTTPVTPAADPKLGMVRVNQLPSIQTLTIQAVLSRQNLPIEKGFANQLPLDLTKDFFPFGERPKFGDSVYLAGMALSVAGAKLTFHMALTNPANSQSSPITPVNAADQPSLAWECWDGQNWNGLTVTDSTKGSMTVTDSSGNNVVIPLDAKNLTISGTVTLALPRQTMPTTVNGVGNYWVRVRLAGGDYGTEASYSQQTDASHKVTGYQFNPATFAAPAIQSITVDYSLTTIARPPETILTYNDFAYQAVTQAGNAPAESFLPFQPAKDAEPSLYVGFILPPGSMAFPNLTISVFGSVADLKYGEKTLPFSPDRSSIAGDSGSQVTHSFWITNPLPTPAKFVLSVLGTSASWASALPGGTATIDLTDQPRQALVQVTIPSAAPPGSSDRGLIALSSLDTPPLVYSAEFVTISGSEAASTESLRLDWQYWNGSGWAPLTVRDDTQNFTLPGLIEFLGKPDFASSTQFGQSRYWIRVSWQKGSYSLPPRLRRLVLNTTMASQTVSAFNLVLGSSDGSKSLKFSTPRSPVLPGQQLQVREPELPLANEQATITGEEGDDAISVTSDATGRPTEIWVRWHEVPDFYGSGPRDRHYVVNHLSGEIGFGDGLNGLIPPVGTNNVRMALYKSGGGVSGNKPAASIVQLKTTVPYVDKVTNTEPATGGSEAEAPDSLISRAPRTVRHRDRALTSDDYADLAMLASPEVARVLCLPVRDLDTDPDGSIRRPGVVSVVIVPRNSDPKPLPSLELIRRVDDYLGARQMPTADLVVVGPEYVRIDVQVEIAVVSLEGAAELQSTLRQEISGFLHPLTGGFEGAGWEFGRMPRKSELFRLIESVPGVDHVRTLVIAPTEDRLGVATTTHFLVYSGTHTIDLVFGES